LSHDKYSENSQNSEKNFRDISEHEKNNKVFGAHENIFWSIKKLDYTPRKVKKRSKGSRKNSREVLID